MDYLVLSRTIMENVIKFEILPHNFDSKDAPITTTLKSSFVKPSKDM